jgi:hypothetical protein
MPILQAQIEIDRPSRYLVQFCKHAAAMGSAGGHSARLHLQGILARREVQVTAEWTDTAGTVTFTPWGLCALTADGSVLTVCLKAADEEGLAQIRDIVTRDFERFTRRNPVTVSWRRSDDPGATLVPPSGAAIARRRRSPLRSGLQIGMLVLAGLVVVGLHIGLGGAAIAGSRWTGVAGNVVVGLIALKIVLIVVARFGLRRRRPAKRSDHA